MARLMKWGGRLMPIGFTSGEIPSVPMNLPLLKNYSIVGVFAGAWAEKFPEQAARMNDALAQLLAEGKIRPHIDRVLPLEQVKEAMRAVASRTVQGQNRPQDEVEPAVGGKRGKGGRSMTSIIIDKRYCGPPNSGNGGYVCGRLARHIPGGAEVTLRAPPPLDKPLDVVAADDGQWELRDGATVVATGRPASRRTCAPGDGQLRGGTRSRAA